jgi:hypothetical protein
MIAAPFDKLVAILARVLPRIRRIRSSWHTGFVVAGYLTANGA